MLLLFSVNSIDLISPLELQLEIIAQSESRWNSDELMQVFIAFLGRFKVVEW